jgi:hypothetical protein
MNVVYNVSCIILIIVPFFIAASCPADNEADSQEASKTSSFELQQSQDSKRDEQETIDAYYILEDLLLGAYYAGDLQYFVKRFSLDYTPYEDEKNGVVIHQWTRKGEYGPRDLYLTSADLVSYKFYFDPDLLCRILGISRMEMEFALEQLGNEYTHSTHYSADPQKGTESINRQFSLGNVTLLNGLVINTKTTELDSRILHETWFVGGAPDYEVTLKP